MSFKFHPGEEKKLVLCDQTTQKQHSDTMASTGTLLSFTLLYTWIYSSDAQPGESTDKLTWFIDRFYLVAVVILLAKGRVR